MTNISETSSTLTREGFTTINLADMAEKPSGAWPRGWYPSEIIEGYTAGAHQFLSGSTVSKAGDSYNFRICFRVSGPEGIIRTMFTSLNYRPIDFTQDRIETVQNLRKEFAGQKGKWVGYEDEQRSSLALAKLGQVQVATGVSPQLNDEGMLNFVPFLGTKPFIRLTIDEETGYNEITGFSQFSNGVAPKARGKKKSA